MEETTIIVLADYGVGDPAFTEVILQLHALLPKATILPQSVPAFSTLATGFWTYQIAMTKNLKNTFLYTNTAPRLEDNAAQKNNRGEKLVYAKLKNGFEVIGVNAQYCFSFVRPEIDRFHFVNVPCDGSQFRSRDIFPQAVSQIVSADYSLLGEVVSTESIPDYPPQVVAAIDSYGNMKTTMRRSEVTYPIGQKLVISFKETSHEGYFTDGIFNVPQGAVAFAPGSSGHDDKFMEIFYRGASAASLFGNVNVEDAFTITAVTS